MLSKINLIMRTLLIMAAVLLSFNFTGCFPYSAKYVNENYDTASIEIRYKQPVTIARYENPRFSTRKFKKSVPSVGGVYYDGYSYVSHTSSYNIDCYVDYLDFDTVYIREQPENFRFEYPFREPKIDIDNDGNLSFEIDTTGTFTCSGNQAVIEIFPYRGLELLPFLWVSDDLYTSSDTLLADPAAYADILESVRIRNKLSDTTYVKYYDLMYDALDKINFYGVIFKSPVQPANHSRIIP